MKIKAITTILFIWLSSGTFLGQDTTVIQTFTFDSTSRKASFQFPNTPNVTYEKILMQYKMRCHDALVGNGNVGCYEWDLHCNTVLTDSNMIDSIRAFHPEYIISVNSGNTYEYSTSPSFRIYSYDQQEVIHNSILTESSATITS